MPRLLAVSGNCETDESAPGKARKVAPARREFTLTAVEETTKAPFCHFCAKVGHGTDECRHLLAKSVQDRWSWVKQQERCFSCLKKNHTSKECRVRKECPEDGCMASHHPLLHRPKAQSVNTQPQAQSVKEVHVHSMASITGQPKVLLRIVPLTLHGPDGQINTHALLDDGSTVTLLDAALAKELGIVGKADPISLRWTDGSIQEDQESQEVVISVSGADKLLHELEQVHTVNSLQLPHQEVEVDVLSQRWPHLQHRDLHALKGGTPRLLIGQSHCQLMVPREVVEGPQNAPVLSRCVLGWAVHGPNGTAGSGSEMVNAVCGHDDLHELVKSSFRTDSFGVRVVREKPRSRQDLRAEAILEKTTRRSGDRWETGLLWRDDVPLLPESYGMAQKRLQSMERKMDRNPAFSEAYCRKLDEYVEKGYASKLSEIPSSNKTWYLPHFGVYNPNKPGKLRLVFDAAARSHGVSLNDALVPGPDLLNPLTGVLFAFRQRKIGFGADIKEMFHQIKIQDEDLPAQQFLWRGNDRVREPDVYRMNVMTFGAVCSPCSAQFVMGHNARTFGADHPEVIHAVLHNHYMDDYFDSANDETSAVSLIKKVIDVQKQGGFIIRNWVSSSREVLEQIPADLRSMSEIEFDTETEMPVEKTLGLRWNPNCDRFSYGMGSKIRSTDTTELNTPTKREVLRLVMSVFDPLGFLACLIVSARVLLQEVWRSGIGWDDKLPDKLVERWHVWWRQLQSLSSFTVPRWYGIRDSPEHGAELHVFCDASEDAFAAVAYLRTQLTNGGTSVAFVIAKTRVAPLKVLSIPRLELQAAVMATRLAEMVQQHHTIKIDRVVFWTDSATVLRWLRADAKTFKPFVGHRLGEIAETTDINQWKWVPSAENAADAASRGSLDTMTENGMWLNGPKFLQQDEQEWPVETVVSNDCSGDVEVKREFVGAIGTATSASLCRPDVTRFSSHAKLIRVTAYAVRYIRNLLARVRGQSLATCPYIKPSELVNAERLWWKKVQQDQFAADVVQLSSDGTVRSDSRLLQLSPVLDADGVIRMNSRD